VNIHNVTQGSPEWHALRAGFFTASEAPAMMGASKYQTRADLLQQKKTRLAEDVSPQKQALFNRGHAAEAAARLIVEEMIGEELYPVTASRDQLLASMDGMNMAETVLFEHKLWNASLAAQVRAGELEPHYYWQLEQQLWVSGAERVIFVCSDGTRRNFVHMDYRPVPGRAESLLAGWRQFATELQGFEPVVPQAEPVGRAPDHLPALHIEVTGLVKASNVDAFKATAMQVLNTINTSLATDQDFANASQTVKWCEDVEARLAAAKEHALSQTASIEKLFRALDEISAETRAKRLELERLVKARKEAIRLDIKTDAERALRDYIAAINQRLASVQLPAIPADFASAIKGKKSIAGLKEGADGELARARAAADTWAAHIEENLASLAEFAEQYGFLFTDKQQLVLKGNDDLQLVIRSRIEQFQEAERLRQEKLAAEVETPKPAPATPAASPLPRPTPAAAPLWHARVVDKSALIAAIAAGYATEDLLTVDQAALDSLANDKGQSLQLAGVTVEKIPAKAA
jgi:putative phage-type endonuclease